MAINNTTAEDRNRGHSQQDTQSRESAFQRATDFVAQGNISNAVPLVAGRVDQYLKSLIEEVDNPILRDLGIDMTNLLSSVYGSPEVLCCLVKNIFLSVAGANDIDNYKKLQKALRGAADFDFAEEFRFDPTWVGIAGMIDALILTVDAIIIFMEMDLRDFAIPILDFSENLYNAVVSVLIMVLQEIIFTLRDTAINWILETIQDEVGEGPHLKCLPFMDLIRLIRTYLHDYGWGGKFFNWFKRLISGHVAKQRSYWKRVNDQNVLNLMKSLDFLKYLRSILVQLKSATLDLSMCIDIDSQLPLDDDVGGGGPGGGRFGLFNDFPREGDNRMGSLSNLNAIVTDDGTILRNSSGAATGPGNQYGYRPPSNNEINAFLQKQLGIPPELANQLTGLTSSLDNIQGTLSDNPHIAGRDCGYVLDSKELASAVLDVAKRFGIK